MKLIPSIEMIDFQPKDKMERYKEILTELKKVSRKELPDHELVDELSKVTYEFFGLKINFMFTPSYFGPCIMLPQSVKNNPLTMPEYTDFGENNIQTLLAESQKVIAKVNLKKAKVEGYFSTILFTIY